MGANLFGANLINTKAPRADFSGAYLKDVLMEGIDLRGGSIRGCYAFRAVFSRGCAHRALCRARSALIREESVPWLIAVFLLTLATPK